MPSPTGALRIALARRFNVIDTDEYGTTKLCCKCGVGEMMPLPIDEAFSINHRALHRGGDEAYHKRPVRGLRRCNNVECATLFDRDHNAAINIRANALHHIRHRCWDPRFRERRWINTATTSATLSDVLMPSVP